MKIAILDDYNDELRTLACFKMLAGHEVTVWNDHVEDLLVLEERLRDAEALVLIRERMKVGAPLLERLKKLRLISQRGDTPNIDAAACTRFGVILSSRKPGQEPSYATAELTWGLLIAAMRRIPQKMAALKAGHWQQGLGYGLHGKTLGILGFGRIGAVVAGYGKAFGMKVRVWAREGARARAQAAGYAVAASQAALFEECDAVSLHVKYLPETRGIVSAADLARMKPSAVLVNTGRAGLIEQGALEAALRAGRPGMAGVDVYDKEPVTGSHPLLALDNVVCTPHIGYMEFGVFERNFRDVFDQVLAYAAGKPVDVVNPEVLKQYQKA